MLLITERGAVTKVNNELEEPRDSYICWFLFGVVELKQMGEDAC